MRFRITVGRSRFKTGPTVKINKGRNRLTHHGTGARRWGGFLLGEKQGAGHRPVRKDEQRKRLANAAQLAICIHGKS
jgi:hypothetical protein